MTRDDYHAALKAGDEAAQLAYADHLREQGDEHGADVVQLVLLVSNLSDEPAVAFMRERFGVWAEGLNGGGSIPRDADQWSDERHLLRTIATTQRERPYRYDTLGEWAETEPVNGAAGGPTYEEVYRNKVAELYASQLPSRGYAPEWVELFWSEMISPDGWRDAPVRERAGG